MSVHEQMYSADGVRQIAQEWWECEITPELAEKLSLCYVKTAKSRARSEPKPEAVVAVFPLAWLKMRLNDWGLLPVAAQKVADDAPAYVTAVLHTGFLTLPETDEMLARLRNEQLCADVNNPARSKMFAVARKQAVAPIDALAGIVTKSTKQERS